MIRRSGLVLVGMALALLLAGVASHYSSAHPDGLAKVATEKGLDTHERASGTAGSPLAGYATRGVADARVSRGLAGVVGVSLTFLVAGAVVLAVSRRSRPDGAADAAAGIAGGPAAAGDPVAAAGRGAGRPRPPG